MDRKKTGQSRSARRTPLALVVAAAIAMAVLVAACGGKEEAPATGAKTEAAGQVREVKLLLSLRVSGKWIAGLVAQKQGYFEDEGLKVELQSTDGSGFVTQQLIAGNSEFGFAGAASSVIAYSKDKNLRALACNEARNVFSINVKSDGPITDVSKLAGYKIGIPEKGGGEDPLVQSVLNENGLQGKVDVVPIGDPGPAVVRALKSDKVHGFASGYTDIATLVAGGIALRDITPPKFVPMPGDCLVTSSEVLAKPEGAKTASGLIRAWTKGALFAIANPDAAVEIVCEKIPEQCTDKEGFTKPYVERILGLLQPVDPNLPPTAIDAQGWGTTADVLKANKIVDGPVDVNGLIADKAVKAVQDEAYKNLDQLKADAEKDAAAG
jgi:NitT/TauT family transport system substrate-binding protein